MDIAKWCERVIRWGFYLLVGLVPLLLTPWNYELFEYNKMMGVYGLTVIIVGTWLIKSISQGKLRITRTPLDIPIALFVASQFVSSIFSIDPHVSWFGYYSRFNGGMLSIISYVVLYYAFVSNLPNLLNLLKVGLATGAVVALYGVAERLGVDKHLWVQDVQNRVFSTMGQPNWLAAYLVALIPIAMALALQFPNKRLLLVIGHWSLVILFFTVLLFTRSRSGLLGFFVADAVFWGLTFFALSFPRTRESSVKKDWMPDQVGHDRKRLFPAFLIVHFAFLIIIFFNGTYIDSVDHWLTFSAWKNKLQLTKTVSVIATPSGTLLEYGGTESGTIRKYVWQGAINAWRSSKKAFLIGTGTETFAFAFYQYRPKEHNLTSEWDFLYNKAHNEYLNYLATTGIFGLGSYLLFIGAFIYWFFKFLKKEIIHIALFAGWISILITNFFGFSVVILQVILFLFPAMALVSNKQLRISFRMPPFISWIVVLFTVVLVIFVAALWYADTLYASGYRESRAGKYDAAVSHLSRASVLNPLEPVFADELGMVYAGLVIAAVGEKDATKAAQLVKQSLAWSDRSLAISPKNVNFWKSRTKIYYSFSEFDPVFNDAAIEALEKAALLSPNDPKITYNLAILYGRKGTNEKAIELLNVTITLKPNYRDAYFALWVFYTEVKRPERARMVLTDYLTKVDPGDKDFLERLNQ